MKIFLISALLAVSALLMIGAAPAPAGGLHPCGDVPGAYAFNIKANFNCAQARGVVRRFECNDEGDCFSGGFECDFKSTGLEEGKLRCERNRDDRVVRWFTAS
jgi:hypothetical protein